MMVKRLALLTMLCFCTLAPAVPLTGHSAELNGFTFGDDSDEIWRNPYFSRFSHIVSLGFKLYGYGDFAGHNLEQQYQQDTTVAGISCIVIRETFYFPTYDDTTSSFDLEHSTAYYTYAKDTGDNVHILGITVFLDDQTISWSPDDLEAGETTLKYPASPEADQQVFRGRVTASGLEYGDLRGCLAISFDSLPQYPSSTVTEYLVPNGGLIAVSYNWEDRLNGYSYDAVAPELAEEEKSGWDKWTDEHCFISACSPGETSLGKALRSLARGLPGAWKRARIALTTALDK